MEDRQTAASLFGSPEEFAALLNLAESNANGTWEETFVSQQVDRHTKYGANMYLSEKQASVIRRIAEGE